jgi:hypothetical protein
MKRNNKQRLFEVMGRLDKTFKTKLNEDFEEIEGTEEIPAEEPVEEKSPEEKLAELTAKVDELYTLLHSEESTEEPEEISIDTGEVENLQEWNFDKKKGEKKEEKEEGEEHEKKESPEFEKGEEELDETKPKIPVAAVAKVGK